MKHISPLLLLACCSSLASVSMASAADLAIVNTEPLSFGKFAAGSGGSVLVLPSGARSATGGVALLSSGASAPARFEVSGDPGAVYAITVPANGTVTLTSSGGQTMPLSDFSVSPPTGQLNASGRQSVAVGARLTVNPLQPSGNYSGSFVVYVDYN